MQGTTESRSEVEFETVGIERLQESKTNPRRAFAKDALSDLTKSIAEKGVLVPLLVRRIKEGVGPAYGHMEILAGARRFRAAKAAGCRHVPVLIRDLDDTQALEVQVIENLQRQDIHPLEEAEGYKQLLERGKYEIADLAAKVGKSESYIYQRLKLAELVPAAKKAFGQEEITAGHAILIARLQPEQQKQALEVATDDYEKMSVRDLGEWIQREILLDLHSASFPKDEENIVPGVQACVNCPKRTGFAPALFPDVKKKDTCTDPGCFHKKAEAFLRIQVAEAQAAEKPLLQLSGDYGKPKVDSAIGKATVLNREAWQDFDHKSAKCPSAEAAIVVDGHNQGKTLSICRDKSCKVHGAGVRESGDGTTDKYRADRLRKEKKRRNEVELRRRIVRAIAEKSVPAIDKLTLSHWQILLSWAIDRMWHDARVALCQTLGIEPVVEKNGYGGTSKDFERPLKARLKNATQAQAARWLLLFAATPALMVNEYDVSNQRKQLTALAELEGVKVSAIEKAFKAELEAKKVKSKTKPPAKSQTSAKAKKPTKAKKAA